MPTKPAITRQVIISGGTRGLGKALSLTLGARGYAVLALYRERKADALALEASFRLEGIEGHCLQQDIAAPFSENSTRVLTETLERAQALPGGLTLIHNAAVGFEPQPLHLIPGVDFERQWRVAVLGGLELSRTVLATMVRMKKGTIVTVLSSAIRNEPPKGFSAYTTAKYALMGLTRALAAEYAPRGIRFFSISPASMDTEFGAQWSPHFRQAVAGKAPSASPEAVATRVCALLEDTSLPARGEDYTE